VVERPARYGDGVSESLPTGDVARGHRALDPLHTLIYFAPEADEEISAVGVRPGRMCYFASRSAPMGPVSPAVTAATFYNFNPALVARYLPRAWTLASIEDILAARLVAADRALRRVLGDDVVASPEVAEAAGLARRAVTDLPPEGRPLYAGHAHLPWPQEPHLVLWHAATLEREFRGDGHIAALLLLGLSGLDALVTHTATGRGFTEAAAKSTRGWSDAEWAAGVTHLEERGLLEGPALTPAGQQLRGELEATTDRLGEAPWRALGTDDRARLIGLAKDLSRAAVAGGAFAALPR